MRLHAADMAGSEATSVPITVWMLTLLLLRGLARSATARMASFAAALLLRRREKKPPEPPFPCAGDAGFCTPRGGDGGGDLPTGVLFWPVRDGASMSVRCQGHAFVQHPHAEPSRNGEQPS